MADIDYDVLGQAIKSALESHSLRKCFMQSSQIIRVPQPHLIAGAFGDVQKAYLAGHQCAPAIAVKTLRPLGDWHQRVRVVAALCRELRVWADLIHPNILALQGFLLDAESMACAEIVTSWQENGNMCSYLAKMHPNEAGRLKLALDTVRGLEYLHNRRPPICHGDLKPENTLVDDHGNAMLCDFGLARIIEDDTSGLTTSRSTKYTTRYASPELLMDERARHTLKSDMWAWGCLVLGIMTDERPYARHSNISLALTIAQGRPPADLAQYSLPDSVTQTLQLCWEKATKLRPTASSCANVLARAIAGGNPQSSYPVIGSGPGRLPHEPFTPSNSRPSEGYVTESLTTLPASNESGVSWEPRPHDSQQLDTRSAKAVTLYEVDTPRRKSLGSTPGPPLDTSARQDPSDNDITESHRPHGKAMSAACHMADIVRAGVTSGFPADSRGSKEFPSKVYLQIIEIFGRPLDDCPSSYSLPSESVATLLNLTQVSRSFHEWTSKILYHRITLRDNTQVGRLKTTLWPRLKPELIHPATCMHSLHIQISGPPPTHAPSILANIAMVLHLASTTLKRLLLDVDVYQRDLQRTICFQPPYTLTRAISSLTSLEEFFFASSLDRQIRHSIPTRSPLKRLGLLHAVVDDAQYWEDVRRLNTLQELVLFRPLEMRVIPVEELAEHAVRRFGPLTELRRLVLISIEASAPVSGSLHKEQKGIGRSGKRVGNERRAIQSTPLGNSGAFSPPFSGLIKPSDVEGMAKEPCLARFKPVALSGPWRQELSEVWMQM